MKGLRTASAVLVLLFVLCARTMDAQTVLSNGVEVSACHAAGLDMPYTDSIGPLTAAPEGYEPFFIEHYGRHGSRYAYSPEFYTCLKKALDLAVQKGVLTEFGKKLDADFSRHYDFYLNRMGDLSNLGWEQEHDIACSILATFPSAFRQSQEGVSPQLFATASSSIRSIMSMSSFCVSFAEVAPEGLCIREEQSRIFLGGTNPRDGHNPFKVKRFEPTMPVSESLDSFQARRLDPRTVLARLFTDVDAACKGQSQLELVRNLYVLVSGMNSVDAADRTDFSGLFTEREYALMWEVDNYQRFLEYYDYVPRCAPVTLDMMKDAEMRMADNTPGMTARFGHDHVLMAVLMLTGIKGYGKDPSDPDQVSRVFQTWDSPMAANIQWVFYRWDKSRGVAPDGEEYLVKVLLNGGEVPVGQIPAGFCGWNEFKTYLEGRIAAYPIIEK